MATALDIPVDQGSDIVYRFQAFDVNGEPFSLAGAGLTLTARLSETDPGAAIQLSTEEGSLQLLDAEAGIWTAKFSASLTSAIPAQPYVYQQYATFPDGSTYRLSQGTVYIDQEIVQ